jgi:hypothetical protein
MDWFKRIAAAAAMALLCAGAHAAAVRFDFTLSGLSASMAGNGNEIDHFAGTSGSGFVVFDVGNADQVIQGRGFYGVSAEVGCHHYLDGACVLNARSGVPVVTSWSFTSILGTVSGLQGLHSISGISHAPDRASFSDFQDRFSETSAGAAEWTSAHFWMRFESSVAPIFADFLDMGEAPRMAGDVIATMSLGNMNALSHGGIDDFREGYNQNFYITSVMATPLDLPEPPAMALLAAALLGALGARRIVNRPSRRRP